MKSGNFKMKNKDNFEQNEVGLAPEVFLNKKPMKNICHNDNRAVLRTNLILKYIKENPYCTAYEISKSLKINYSTTSMTIKNLIYVNLISYKLEIGENNRTHKRLFIPIKQGDKKNEN